MKPSSVLMEAFSADDAAQSKQMNNSCVYEVPEDMLSCNVYRCDI